MLFFLYAARLDTVIFVQFRVNIFNILSNVYIPRCMYTLIIILMPQMFGGCEREEVRMD